MKKRDRLKPKHKRVKKDPLKLFVVHPKLYDAFVKYSHRKDDD